MAGRGASPRGGGGRQAQESERGLAEGFQIHKTFKVIDFMQPSENLQNKSHESRFFKIIDPQHIHPQEFAAEKAADKETKEEEEGEGVEQDTGDGGGDEEEAKKDEGGQGEGGGQAQEDTSDPGDGSPAGEGEEQGEAGPVDGGPVQEEKEEEEEKTTEGQNQETEPSEAAADDDQPVEEQVDSGES